MINSRELICGVLHPTFSTDDYINSIPETALTNRQLNYQLCVKNGPTNDIILYSGFLLLLITTTAIWFIYKKLTNKKVIKK